jgi:two-component system response regulator AtoC
LPTTGPIRLLITDTDASLLRALAEGLSKRGHNVKTAQSGFDALSIFRAQEIHFVLMGGNVGSQGGVRALKKMKQLRPEVLVIAMPAAEDTEFLFQISKVGADDFIFKPFKLNEIEAKLLRLSKQRAEPAGTPDRASRNHDFTLLFGTSPKMEEVKMTIEQVAETNATVLIRGESGTGKEVVARMVHASSPRAERPFVKVNCAAIPNELLESELFGYEPGAFTGAHRQKLGKFDQANNGTIFLDEISEMHPALQAKLLHVLQDGEFARLGGKRDIGVDVRVLAATNKPLERNVAEGTFREDLFYRLNVVTIHIPPLRERREEIPVFLEFFLQKYSDYYGKQPARFGEYAVQKMMEYAWPGNIRELENLVKRYTIVGNESQIIRELATHKPILYSTQPQAQNASVPSDTAAMGHGGRPGLESESLLEIGRRAAMSAEREAIERVLMQTRWNRRQAARILKISYKALLNKIKIIEGQTQANQGN